MATSVNLDPNRIYLKTEEVSIEPSTVMSSQSNTRPSRDENKLPVSSNAMTSRSSGDCPRRSSLVVVVISIRLIRFTNTSARRILPVTIAQNIDCF